MMMYKNIIKFIILSISITTSMILHELVHVSQYMLLYGSDITYLSVKFGVEGVRFSETVVWHYGTSFTSDWSYVVEWLFYEIPAYLIMVLVFWYGYKSYVWCVEREVL